jgi:hypothetical protein
MSDISDKSNFQFELERKLDDLIAWVIANTPEKSSPLTNTDFTEVRNNLYKVLAMSDDPFLREPEPSEGGAQYVNVTAAPWP